VDNFNESGKMRHKGINLHTTKAENYGFSLLESLKRLKVYLRTKAQAPIVAFELLSRLDII